MDWKISELRWWVKGDRLYAAGKMKKTDFLLDNFGEHSVRSSRMRTRMRLRRAKFSNDVMKRVDETSKTPGALIVHDGPTQAVQKAGFILRTWATN
jgi:hypothetical protein